MFQPQAVVKTENRRLAHRASRSPSDWLLRVPLEFDRSSIAHLDDQTAASRTTGTGRCVILRSSRNQALRLRQIRHRPLDWRPRTAGERSAGKRESGRFQEATAGRAGIAELIASVRKPFQFLETPPVLLLHRSSRSDT